MESIQKNALGCKLQAEMAKQKAIKEKDAVVAAQFAEAEKAAKILAETEEAHKKAINDMQEAQKYALNLKI